jgi:hypothetical protein
MYSSGEEYDYLRKALGVIFGQPRECSGLDLEYNRRLDILVPRWCRELYPYKPTSHVDGNKFQDSHCAAFYEF